MSKPFESFDKAFFMLQPSVIHFVNYAWAVAFDGYFCERFFHSLQLIKAKRAYELKSASEKKYKTVPRKKLFLTYKTDK